jgi:chitinase
MSVMSLFHFRKSTSISLIFLLVLFVFQAVAQDCSKDNPCATGCCSKHGYCGTGDDFCGTDCVDTCDYKLGCDASNPCEQGCCNKFGFCGLGPDCECHLSSVYYPERRTQFLTI